MYHQKSQVELKGKYKIVKILHSGRKDERMTERHEEKYDGLVGSIVRVNNINQYDSARMVFFQTDSIYEWFTTSPVLQLTLGFDNLYYLETVDTIYVLQNLNKERQDDKTVL